MLHQSIKIHLFYFILRFLQIFKSRQGLYYVEGLWVAADTTMWELKNYTRRYIRFSKLSSFLLFSHIFFIFYFSKLKQRVGFWNKSSRCVSLCGAIKSISLGKRYVENCHSSILCWNVWFFYIIFFIYLPFCFVDGTSIKNFIGNLIY